MQGRIDLFVSNVPIIFAFCCVISYTQDVG